MKALEHILMVEDDPDIQTVARLALEVVGGLKVDLFSSGFEALKRVHRINPDLVLLDVMMPEIDGPTTLRKLREIEGFQTTPVIFMTAKVQPQEVEELKKLGALTVIAKPFDPMQLADNIRAIWREHHGG